MQRSRILINTFARSSCVRNTITTQQFRARSSSLRQLCQHHERSLYSLRPFLATHKYRAFSHSAILRDAATDGVQYKAATMENGLTISDKAIKQLKYIAERDNDDSLMLRILVDSGGCHGYQNKLELTDTVEEDDTVFESEGVKVVVDSISLQFVRGSTVDFVEELIGSTFQVIDNPNAKNSCGCNISYDIDLDMLTQN
ncbi:hypothetical protein BDB00DRAFT_855995 [Zychaea mexicana]|uniref:uncharacterized protein n=1 Tax=Zychaea mexicana TaxID=64656 RepID=UPI0022FF3223|nr:uncharacterized protein BDB00DRAFT_855995 [Zychaea mexicana]KAI9484388.1 hypothetical protein BDB00DRAFT_855995 [Zychaea mexicana]